jgi:hypothetical protein
MMFWHLHDAALGQPGFGYFDVKASFLLSQVSYTFILSCMEPLLMLRITPIASALPIQMT